MKKKKIVIALGHEALGSTLPEQHEAAQRTARAVADFIRDNTTLDPALIKSSGRGEYVPVADNTTEEGRARNRRVEIKVYNSYNSDGATE